MCDACSPLWSRWRSWRRRFPMRGHRAQILPTTRRATCHENNSEFPRSSSREPLCRLLPEPRRRAGAIRDRSVRIDYLPPPLARMPSLAHRPWWACSASFVPCAASECFSFSASRPDLRAAGGPSSTHRSCKCKVKLWFPYNKRRHPVARFISGTTGEPNLPTLPDS